jgi:hypothetical protein
MYSVIAQDEDKTAVAKEAHMYLNDDKNSTSAPEELL